MSCGLGAIVLVFMLVKHNVDTIEIQEETLHQEQASLLESEIGKLQDRETDLREAIDRLQVATANTEAAIRRTSKNLSNTQEELSTHTQNIEGQRKRLSELKRAIENAPPAKTTDVLEDRNAGEENYLIGLKVEGRRIAVLVDASASMTDERLLDVIRRKNASDQHKKSGPKWLRTKRIIRWILSRLPASSTVDVIAFSDKAKTLGATGWKPSRDANTLGGILRDLDELVPSGPTNLEVGLKAVSRATNIYLITDGLPTAGSSNYKSLNPFSSCSALWGGSSKISGDCRLKLFGHTIKSSGPSAGIPVNVILLPIEGDPAASVAYWSWTSATGGLMITPAEGWP